MADYESVLCVKNTVHVYKIPPRPSNRGYRAADWKLDEPDWTGRLRIVSKGKELYIKLEDKTSGDLFAQCPVEQYPGIAVESVTDSSRYFVLRIKDDGGRSAFIGIGFEDRGDSFDLNVSLQDHFKWLKTEEEAKSASTQFDKGPKLDLGFKEGQTIKINIGTKRSDSSNTKARPRGNAGGGIGILPPPPGGVKLPAPPGGGIQPPQPSFVGAPVPTQPQAAPVAQNNSSSASSNIDFLFDLGPRNNDSAPLQPQAVQSSSDPWGDFASAGRRSAEKQ
ncbi:adaptin ear-binding coat-associated protein 1-like isoform X2 [Mizuhopecten yessoensis]|uniref:adaptin ear-binding coat-associated protein 1-like isoform X2 n=1 Tax=Mizuhopecten yessoensis TaxID=6573 RepID=UPI000B45A9EE|nr:adaptin ear-binding coat-associated protein 1-like isoform X2 [Mizuhopecten yessoensis]